MSAPPISITQASAPWSRCTFRRTRRDDGREAPHDGRREPCQDRDHPSDPSLGATVERPTRRAGRRPCPRSAAHGRDRDEARRLGGSAARSSSCWLLVAACSLWRRRRAAGAELDDRAGAGRSASWPASVAMPSERSIIAVATRARAHPCCPGQDASLVAGAAWPPSGPVTTSTSPGRPTAARAARFVQAPSPTDQTRAGEVAAGDGHTVLHPSRQRSRRRRRSRPAGRTRRSANWRAPIAARSERFAVAVSCPTSRGAVRARSKWTPSTRMSLRITVPSLDTASSPIPRTRALPDGLHGGDRRDQRLLVVMANSYSPFVSGFAFTEDIGGG